MLDAGRISMAKVVLAAALLMGMSRGPGIVWTKPGDLRVVVVDRASVPIPGVTVTFSPAAQKALVTDSRGRVEFTGLVEGEYSLTFELSGFARMTLGPVGMRSSATENPRLPEFLIVMNPVMVVG
jgi:Carboxypeptidase regulatory-like domain